MNGVRGAEPSPRLVIPTSLTSCQDLPPESLLEEFEAGSDTALSIYLELSDVAYSDCRDTLEALAAEINAQQSP